MNWNRAQTVTSTPRHPASFTARSFEQVSIVQPGPLTQDVGIVRGRADAHSLGSATERVAERLRQLLDLVGDILGAAAALGTGTENFVQHDYVVGGAAGALDYVVRLKEEIPHALFGYAAIDDGAGLEIATGFAAGFGVHVLVCRVEARVMSLADDDDGEFGLLLNVSLIHAQ